MMDRSQQFKRTDRDIQNAVIALLDKTNFEQITINDITKQAEINRSTFYLHFQDKYDVLENITQEYINEFTKIIDKVTLKGENSFQNTDSLLKEYFAKNRENLLKLTKIKYFENDFETEVKDLFCSYFLNSSESIQQRQAKAMSSIIATLLMYMLEHPEFDDCFSSIAFNTFLDLTLQFFNIPKTPDAYTDLLTFIGKHIPKHDN